MKKQRKRSGAEQVIMRGIVTEEQIVKGFMRKIGSKGGSRNTPEQLAARRNNLLKARQARERREENEDSN